MKHIVLVLSLLVAGIAFANGNNNGPTCTGNQNCDGGTTVNNDSSSSSTAVGIGVGVGLGGDATSYNTNVNGQGQEQGQSQYAGSDSSSESNASAYNSGNNASQAYEGSQSTSVTVEGDYYRTPVSTAVAAAANNCANGVGYQGPGLGLSVSKSRAFCDTLQLAALFCETDPQGLKCAKYIGRAEDIAGRANFWSIVRSSVTLGILD